MLGALAITLGAPNNTLHKWKKLYIKISIKMFFFYNLFIFHFFPFQLNKYKNFSTFFIYLSK